MNDKYISWIIVRITCAERVQDGKSQIKFVPG